MSAVLNAFTTALAVLGMAAWIAAREWGRVRGRNRRIMQGMLAAGLLLSLVVVVQTAFPRRPLARATLRPGQQVEYVSTGAPLALVAHAQLPEVHSDRSVSLDYSLSVRQDGEVVDRPHVLLEERWGHRRVGGRNGGQVPVLQARDEQRLPLVPIQAGSMLTVGLDLVNSKEPSPLDVAIVHAPTPPLWIGLLGGLLTVAATVLDVRVPRRTHQGLVMGFLTVFCLLLTAGVTPRAGVSRVVTTGFVGLAAGAVVGLVLRFVVDRLAGLAPAEPVKRKATAR
jgi:hypothetical protein